MVSRDPRTESPAVAGRAALVTGAASGIGLAVATRLHEEGARLTLVDLPGAALDAAVARLPGSRGLPLDLSRPDEVEQALATLEPVDVLVSNAGLQHVSPLDEFPLEHWERLLAVMLTAPFLFARRALPGMVESGWGRIVNIASIHGLVASRHKAAYVAAKHGLLGLTKVTALEAADRCPDVTAHAICPSYVRTPLVERQIDAHAELRGLDREDVLSEILLEANAVKRLIEPDEVAEAVLYLCRPGAWALTGGVLTLDAGWLAH